jgi:hypothetical protein
MKGNLECGLQNWARRQASQERKSACGGEESLDSTRSLTIYD